MTSKFKKTCIALAAGAGMILAAAGGADAIVNGTESAADARPYQVSLQAHGEHYCGGSIIDATTIVTAAHCVEGESASTTTIRAGVTDATSSAGQDVRVTSITSHPDYARNGLADIAIIKLAEPLTLAGNVQAIPLATAAELNAADTGVVSGWGAVSENGESSNELLEADVPLVSDASCAVSLGTDAATETCAGGTGTDTCYGDSGGPLAIQTGNGLALAGVTSWGEECGAATPGAYADVPGLTNWITAASNGEVAPNPTPAPDAANQGAEDGDFEDFFEDGEFEDGDFEDFFEDGEFEDGDFEDFFEDGEFEDGDFEDFFEDGDFEDDEYEDDGYWLDVEVLDTGETLSLFIDDDGSVWLLDE